MSTTIRRMSMSVGLVAISATAIAANGDLDPSFGTGGFRLAGITDGISSIPTNMALQPDGKILICDGENSASSGQDFFIARFTADGGIDTSFSFDGHTTIDFSGGADICSGIAVQADGKIVVSGTTTPTAPGSSTDFAVARFNSDGTLDTATFGAGTGKAVYGFDLGGNNQDQALSLALKADGRIVLAGSAQTVSNGLDFAILQLLADGTRDASFNLTGRDEALPGPVTYAGGRLWAAGLGLKVLFNEQTGFLVSVAYRAQNTAITRDPAPRQEQEFQRLAVRAGFAF